MSVKVVDQIQASVKRFVSRIVTRFFHLQFFNCQQAKKYSEQEDVASVVVLVLLALVLLHVRTVVVVRFLIIHNSPMP